MQQVAKTVCNIKFFSGGSCLYYNRTKINFFFKLTIFEKVLCNLSKNRTGVSIYFLDNVFLRLSKTCAVNCFVQN